MAKVRLLVWTVALGVVAAVLLQSTAMPPSADPAATTMAVVRIVAGMLAAYLCAATLLAVRLPRLAPSFVRRMVAAAVSGGILLAPSTASTASAEPARPATVEAPVLRRVPANDEGSTTTTPEPAPAPATSTVAAEIVIEPGDHLWSVAERTMAERLGRPPSDAEIVPFWTRLIDVNRDRLIGGDPDLVFPGQRFVLPS